MSLLENTLGQDAHWQLNKAIVYEFGFLPALLLSDLIAKRRYFRSRGELDNAGGFFNTQENLISDLETNEKALRKAKRVLEEGGVLRLKRRGVPSKHYFYIQDETILAILSRTSPAQMGTTRDDQTGATSYAQKGTAINKNKEQKQSKKKARIVRAPEPDHKRVKEIFQKGHDKLNPDERMHWPHGRFGKAVKDMLDLGDFDKVHEKCAAYWEAMKIDKFYQKRGFTPVEVLSAWPGLTASNGQDLSSRAAALDAQYQADMAARR